MTRAFRKTILLALMLGLVGVGGCQVAGLLRRENTPTPSTPNFSQLIPDDWIIEKVETVDIDQDGEDEWLVIYRYEQSPRGFGGPLGGVIYDRQPDRSPQNLATPEPYRPSILVAYHLLPAKGGKGYLGENVGGKDKPWPEVGEYDANGDGKEELVIRGYSAPDVPTSLAIFRWVDVEKGYQAMIQAEGENADVLWGDAGIELEPEFKQGPIKRVIVKTRLYQPYWYLRSRLGRRIVYEWNDSKTYLEKKSEGVGFVFGRPRGAEQPKQKQYPVAYPEAAVLAYYEDWRIEEIVSVREDKDEAQVKVRLTVNDQLVEDVCSLTRKSTGKVKDVAKWEVTCPE